MAFRDTWHRTLVYFGLAEDDAYEDDELEPYHEPEVELQDSYRERLLKMIERIEDLPEPLLPMSSTSAWISSARWTAVVSVEK